MNRSDYNWQERMAAALLDKVKEGEDFPEQDIHWALWVLGDAVGVKHLETK